MGRAPNHKTRGRTNPIQNKTKKAVKTRDLDQVWDDMQKPEETMKKRTEKLDEDLPGLGQFYCLPCAKYFQNMTGLETHRKQKTHKRRLKDLKEKPWTTEDAYLPVDKGLPKKEIKDIDMKDVK